MDVTGRPLLNIARRWNRNISHKPATCGYDGSSSISEARTTSHIVPDSHVAGGKLFRVGRSAREFGGASECVPLSPIYHRCRDKGRRPRAAIPPQPRLGHSTCYPHPTFFPAIRASTFHISDHDKDLLPTTNGYCTPLVAARLQASRTSSLLSFSGHSRSLARLS